MGIHDAAKEGNLGAVKKFLDQGVDVDERSTLKLTPLHAAAEAGKADVVALLLEKGATVDAREVKKATPLHLAAGTGQDKVVELLIEGGADASAVDTYQQTALHRLAVDGGKSKPAAQIAIINRLIEAGCNVNSVTNSGRSPLWLAASTGKREVVQALLDRGADPKIKAKGTQGTAADAAAAKGHKEILALLKSL